MFTSWAELSGIEIINAERLRALLLAADCPPTLLRSPACETLNSALGGADWADVATAPWYDPSIPASARFYGIEAVEVTLLGDTNRTVSSVASLVDGEVFISKRKSGRQVRYRVVLIAADSEALDYGRSWLSAVLDGTRCGQSGGCDLMTLRMLADCPEDAAAVPGLTRQMLEAVCTAGPTVISTERLEPGRMETVEFTLSSELPHLYALPDVLGVTTQDGPSPVVETTRNLILNPRPVLTQTAEEVGRNLIVNASFEANAANWTATLTGVDPASLTSVRSNDVRAWPIDFKRHGDYMGRFQQFGGESFSALLEVVSAQVAVNAGQGIRAVLSACSFLQLAEAYNFTNAFLEIQLQTATPAGSWETLAMVTTPAATATAAGSLTGLSMNQRATVPAGHTRARLTAAISTIRTSPGLSQWYYLTLYLDRAAIITGPIGTHSSLGWDDLFPYGTNAPDDFTYAWAGTAHASASIYRRALPLRWSDVTLTHGVGWFLKPLSNEAIIVVPGNPNVGDYRVYAEADDVQEGSTYFPQVEAMVAFGTANLIDMRVSWRDAGNAEIGNVSALTSTVALTGGYAVAQGDGVVAPAGAVAARLILVFDRNPNPARVGVRRAALIEDISAPFFDGSTLDTPQWGYDWDGTPNDSVSLRTVGAGEVVDPLRDPDCEPPPTPPTPPPVPDDCAADVTSWTRHYYLIGSSDVPETLRSIPAFSVTPTGDAIDAMRISVIENPSNLPPESIDGNEPVAFWEVTYLPAAATLTFDTLTSDVTATIGGSTLPAGHLVIGRGGQPLTFPTLSCGDAYLVVIDLPYQPLDPIPAPLVQVESMVEYR